MALVLTPIGPASVATNGTSDVTLQAAPGTGEAVIIDHVVYVNGDSIIHTAILKKDDGSSREHARVAGVPVGNSEDDFKVSVSKPIHLEEGQLLKAALGEAHSSAAGHWWIHGYLVTGIV